MQEQGQIGNMMHVAVVREVVQVVVQLLHILSMVSLPSTQPQQGEIGNMMHVAVVREVIELLHILPMVSLPSTQLQQQGETHDVMWITSDTGPH